MDRSGATRSQKLIGERVAIRTKEVAPRTGTIRIATPLKLAVPFHNAALHRAILAVPIGWVNGNDCGSVPECEVRRPWDISHTSIIVDSCNFQSAVIFRAVAPNTYEAVMESRCSCRLVRQAGTRILTYLMTVQLDLKAKRVDQPNRIQSSISEEVEASLQTDRIRSRIPPRPHLIPPVYVVVHPRPDTPPSSLLPLPRQPQE